MLLSRYLYHMMLSDCLLQAFTRVNLDTAVSKNLCKRRKLEDVF